MKISLMTSCPNFLSFFLSIYPASPSREDYLQLTLKESSTLSGPQISILSSYFPDFRKKYFVIDKSPPAVAGDLQVTQNDGKTI